MPTSPTSLVTAAQIARLAGVSRATVSIWRRRHRDFPTPAGGTDGRPTFDLTSVRAWLAARGQLPPDSPAGDLRAALRHGPPDPGRWWALLLAAARVGSMELAAALDLPDRHLATRAAKLINTHAATLPAMDRLTYHTQEAPLLRALLRCVRDEGAPATADLLATAAEVGTTAAGTHPTPPPLTELMTDLLAQAGDFPASVCDPACGTGGLLVAAARRGAVTLYGRDVLAGRAAQAAVRVALAAPQATIDVRVGDSLREPVADQSAEAVLCTPPYGLRDWGHDEMAYDPRWSCGLPPKGEPELAWAQHCLALLADGGLAVLLLPPAVSERASGRRIRAELIRTGALRAVVALPPGAAVPRHVGLHIWLLRRPRAHDAAPPAVLFIDASDLHAGDDEPVDWAALRATVPPLWRSFLEEDLAPQSGVARAVPVVDLLDELVDLSPARRVGGTPAGEPQQHSDAAHALRARLRHATGMLATLNRGAPWPVAGAEHSQWRTATVADLLRGGALSLLRPPGGREPHDPADEQVPIAAGDIVLTEVLRHGVPAATVVDAASAGQPLRRDRCLLRPDPRRLDPWFLTGFMSAEDNLHAASAGTSVVRVDPRRLRVPLLPLAEQRRYGRAFRRLAALRTAADLACRLAGETTRTLAAGLTSGSLLPPAPTDHPTTTAETRGPS